MTRLLLGSQFSRSTPALALSLAVWVLAVSPRTAQATERRFTYTYESGVLRPGDKEIEPWTTLRKDKIGFYNRIDERIELEVGVAEGLQSAWYVNFSGIAENVGSERKTSSQFGGVSWELKYQLSDPVADAFGSAAYLEMTLAPNEAEIEAKAIFDKRIEGLLFAFNVVGTYVVDMSGKETETEQELEGDLGVAYFLSPAVSLGVEARNHNLFKEGMGWAYSALFLGPALSYAAQSWWVTLTVAPQIAALKGATPPTNLHLVDHERMEARVIFAFHL